MDKAFKEARHLQQIGEFSGAIEKYKQLLEKKSSFDILNNLAECQLLSQHDFEAAEYYSQALQLNENSFAAHANLAAALYNLKKYDDAIEHCRRAIEINPKMFEPYNVMGLSLEMIDRKDEAIAAYHDALKIKSDSFEVHNNLGIIFSDKERYSEAKQAFQKAIELKPKSAEPYNNLGIVYAAMGEHEKAIIEYKKAIEIKPSFAHAHYNLGVSLQVAQFYSDAISEYCVSLADSPENIEIYNNLGGSLGGLHQYEESVKCYEKALTIDPNYAQAHWNLSLALLALGQYERGWREYEWRKKLPDAPKNNYTQPHWQGESIKGKTILLTAEQGHGDVIHFMRYVPMVSELGANVILSLPGNLVRLGRTIDGNISVFSFEETLPDFDLQCSLLSLPFVFKTTMNTIPCNVPYVKAPEQQIAYWKNKVSSLSGLRVGLVWAGEPRTENSAALGIDKRRSIPLIRLGKLNSVKGINLISLQKGSGSAELKIPHGLLIHDWTDELNDFSDTAALIEALDLVITVDTSVVHLSGALGKKTWLLNRHDACWRWLIQRTDNPWYPTVKIFRKSSPTDWETPINAIINELHQLVANKLMKS